ncbi:DUF1036 domain-containing protein [Rhodospira trueperi]|uniref:DUF1036 domain-containing protein n=1 Tax=Rhodospira trueperi TaxID=69960 RepID=UPI001C40955D|nr:DUF1036 domain-containing protein [Rhodospira trueperi]
MSDRVCRGVAGTVALVAMMTAASAAHAGLEVCNHTSVARWLAIGYLNRDEVWSSEGWWHVEPGDCVKPIEDDLTQRYYYYRAEDPNEQFEGDGFFFCAVPDAFNIVGDSDCTRRGYQELDFREVDTGDSAVTFTLVLNARTVPGARPMNSEGSGGSAPPPDEEIAAVPNAPPPSASAPSASAPQTPDTADAAPQTPPESPFGAPAADGGASLSSAHQAIQGAWRSLDDRAARITFDEDLYASYHAGDLMETGPYEVATACPGQGGGEDGDPVIVVRLVEESAPQCYGVLYVDGSTLELLALPRGNLLRYEASE